MLIHGIRTQAEWQQLIKEVLEQEPGVKVIPASYGFFDVLRFLLPFRWARRRPVDRIYELIRDAQRLYPHARLSILAHSFGTYIVGRILEREFDIKLHRLAFCGSVLPNDYPWQRMDLGRIDQIVNDCGWRDIWPVLAQSVTWGYGSSGTFGFGSTRIDDRFHDFRHGDFFSRKFAEDFWQPFFGRGELIPGRSDRPTTPWWFSALTVAKLRYAIVGAMAAALAGAPFWLVPQKPPKPPPEPLPALVGLRLDPDPLELDPGGSFRLGIAPLPPGTRLPIEQFWSSEDARIATVSSDGVVGGVGRGWTRVFAFVRGAGFEALMGETTVLVGLPNSLAADAPPGEGFTLLALSDLPAPLGEANVDQLARVRTLRRDLSASGRDVLVLQNGELGGTVSGPSGPGAVTELLARLDGRPREADPWLFVAPRRRHVRELASRAASAEAARSGFNWLTEAPANPGADPRHGMPLDMLEIGGWPVGLFNLGLAKGEPDGRLEIARSAIRELRRRGSRMVIGLTRSTSSEDLELARQLGPDDRVEILLSGGDGAAAALFVAESGTWVLRAEADARRVVVADIRARDDGSLETSPRLVPIESENLIPDPEMLSLARGLGDRAATEICRFLLELPAGCLERMIGRTQVPLDASHATIRRLEAAIGNWVADSMRTSLAESGAQVALINAGALRLNRQLPAGAELTGTTVFELQPFRNRLVLLRLDGETLTRVMWHARESRGTGAWLQVSGLAFRAGDGELGLTLLGADGRGRPVAPDEEVLVATVDFLATGGDGFGMLSEALKVADGPLLQTVILEALEAAPETGIAPRVEGRICDARLPGPCLATPEK